MTEAEARARIERLTAADYDPVLETADVDVLMEIAATDDPEVWNTYRALGAGWEIKAGRAAADFRFEEDNQSFYREQVYRACAERAKRYNRHLVTVPMITEEGAVV
jgi:hypothetical protein